MNRTAIVLIFITAGIASLGAAGRPPSSKIVRFGTETAVLFDGLKSPDGRYAVGWTIRPRSKDAQPVDWAGLKLNFVYKFLDRYETQEPGRPDTPYELNNCVVDLHEKKMLVLPAEWANWPGNGSHGSIDAAWSSASGQARYALVQNEGRFSTYNLWLVVIDDNGMHQLDLVPRLKEPVLQFLKKRKPSGYERYQLSYPLHSSGTRKISFKGSVAEIPFSAEVPKSMEAPLITGTVKVALPDGVIDLVAGNR
jgi:hypothetical protein